VWVIVEAITFTLNLVISTYLMNQSRGHWLLSNALTTSTAFTMEMEVALLEFSTWPKISNPFETKILFLRKNM
jgi:hypothetical protein